MARVLTALAACCCAAVFAPASGGGGASAAPAFSAGGGALVCGVELFPHEPARPVLTCWRPRDGRAVSMRAGARPRAFIGRAYRGYRPPVPSVLRAGETWWVSRSRSTGRGPAPAGFLFRCTAGGRSVTCVGGGGRGWWLGYARGYRLR